MKKIKKVVRKDFKQFMKESWQVYLVVSLVLIALGILYVVLLSGNILFTFGLIIFIVCLMMLLEYTMWKRGK